MAAFPDMTFKIDTSDDPSDRGVAVVLRKNSVDSHIQYKKGQEWLSWNFGLQQWRRDEYLGYLGTVADELKKVEFNKGEKLPAVPIGKKYAVRLETYNSLQLILKFLAQMPEFSTALWDRDANLVGTANGVVDIKTLEFRKQQPKDYISISSPVIYNPEAKAPRFEKFISEILPDPNIARYTQKLLGSGLLPSAPDQLFHFWQGGGANGKSVLRSVVAVVLGPLCGSIPTSLFIRNSDESANRFSLSRVQNCRIIFANEIPGGRALEEYRVKQLCGEDSVVVEEKGRPQQEATFFATLIMLVNEIPTISDQSVAMRRRLRIVPFNQRFDENADQGLRDKLLLEREGILAWLIRGAHMWLKEGLAYPDAIKKATGQAIRQSFSLHDFLSEILEADSSERVFFKEIRDRYLVWAKDRGTSASMSNRAIGDAIEAFMGKVDKGDSHGIFYRGWKVRKEPISTSEPIGSNL